MDIDRGNRRAAYTTVSGLIGIALFTAIWPPAMLASLVLLSLPLAACNISLVNDHKEMGIKSGWFPLITFLCRQFWADIVFVKNDLKSIKSPPKELVGLTLLNPIFSAGKGVPALKDAFRKPVNHAPRRFQPDKLAIAR